MVRKNVDAPDLDYRNLIESVIRGHVGVELERDSRVVARITPAEDGKARTAEEWNTLFRALPPLGDDAEAFANDIESFRQALPPQSDSWVD